MRMLDVHTVAERLRINRRSVQRLIETGTLQAVVISPAGSKRKHYRVSEDAYNKYLEKAAERAQE